MDAHTLTHNLGGFWRNGQGHAPCPICQPEKRRDQTGLSIGSADGKILLHCFKSGCSFVEIARAAEVPLGDAQVDFDAQRENDEKQQKYAAQKLAKARSLWDCATPIEGTKAGQYLRGRGITCTLPDSLRFMADIHHHPSSTWAMAMVADVQPMGGVHRTFFDKRGDRLQKNAKMMLGPCAGGAVRLSNGDGPLVVCEGIETGLSLLSGLLDGPATVWAALSTSGMKALNLPPDTGEIIVATDGDEPGHEAGVALADRASALGWSVKMLSAPDGCDWNDVLMQKGEAA